MDFGFLCKQSVAVVCTILLSRMCFAAEGRIPIYQPVTIDQPGSYIVTRDISVSTGSALTITASRVTVDLDGHTIFNTGTSDSITNGGSGSTDIHIKNGKLNGGSYQIHLTGGQFILENLNLGSGKGIRIDQARVAIRKTVVLNSSENGIFLIAADGAILEENTIRGSAQSGIELQNTFNSYLGRNNVSANGLDAVSLHTSQNNLIIDNIVSDNAATVGIRLDSSGQNTIDRNLLSRNQTGIRLISSPYNVVGFNNVSGSDANGIELNDSSFNHLHHNVTSSSTTQDGIRLSGTAGGGSDYNNLEWNTAGNNGDDIADCGISFTNTDDHNLYSNNRTLNNGLSCTTCGICDPFSQNVDGGGNVNQN